MAYDEFLADRIRQHLKDQHIVFSELKMMGGLCFKVDNKMLCGIHLDKTYGDHLLMARIGETAYTNEIEKPECLPMDFTGRPMKGYVFVTPDGFDSDADLSYWIDLCLAFNPLAKASKPRKKS
ncbi:RNA methyltransferase [Tamlana fucoidanivorans]|uniref:TfoX/Sxy family protein n=1 Tax=Allotamlana fucoidanivorans TaxID=2583814 RepID=A0A5C4SFJ2_9FLAO|nr:TfoX/Sxy family protein [Tamlana fucoidanivorans]TNJ42124.1 TfoX/Sxy family protein [Tamlana fucoidanivorans]